MNAKKVINDSNRCFSGWRFFGRGMKWVAIENQSAFKTTMLPFEGGGLYETDSGWRTPSGGELEVLEVAQTEQAKTKSRMSWAIDCHQNHCLVRNVVRLAPGWQPTLEQWPQWRAQPGGHPGRDVTPCKVVWTFDSISQVTIETMTFCCKMNAGDDRCSDCSKTLDKASSLMFLEPGW